MVKFTPTPEQTAIVTIAKESKKPFHVIARAGCAKTSTLGLIAAALPRQNILALAFNKDIATDMVDNFPSNVTPKTLNSFGLAAWKSHIGKWPKTHGGKLFFIIRDYIADLYTLNPDLASALDEAKDDFKDFVNRAKSLGYLPEGIAGTTPLADYQSLVDSSDIEIPDEWETPLNEILALSWTEALAGKLDFTDQIYCPVLAEVPFPIYDLILIDEAQDLSSLDQKLLYLTARLKSPRPIRVIVVGDPLQAIYAFRGADSSSMSSLQSLIPGETFPLTTTFRCAKNIVAEARWRAPDLVAAPSSPDGIVSHLPSWGVDIFSPGDAIICRNNAPLFSLAMKLLSANILPSYTGRDVCAQLKKIISKFGGPTLTRSVAERKAAEWFAIRDAVVRSKGFLRDQYSAILTVLSWGEDIKEALEKLTLLENAAGNIILTTGHQSKGREWENVFILDQSLIDFDATQDKNLLYVMQTRAKSSLTYISSKGFEH